jgi:outer membrane protein assembly factor BamB
MYVSGYRFWRIFGFIFATLALASATSAQEGAPLVKHLLELTNKSNGVCLVPRGSDLVFDLVKGSEFVVVSQEPTAARAAAMRARADQAGFLGRRLYIAEAAASSPVLADSYANVLIVADATDDLLAQLDPKTMLRVLTPHGGKAVVGLAKTAQGILTRARLETWARGFGVPAANVKIADDAEGLFAIITRPPLAGAAEWTHRLFDSGFNPVSTDTAFTMPSMTQWLGTPYNEGAGAPRIAGGRLLMVMEGAYNSRPECEVNYLVMRDAYNGAVLWKRDLGTQYAADYYLSAAVLTAEELYLVDLPNPTVLVLDPDTGKELRKIDCSALGQQVKWIAFRDGVLFVAAGGTDRTGGVWGGVFGAQHVKFLRQDEKSLQDSVAVGNNRMIGAFDPKTGKALWTHDEGKDCIPEFFLAVRDGRVYFLAQEKYAAALDAQTGKPIWTNPEAAATYKSALYPQFSVSSGALMATGDTLLFARPGSARIALNAADGKTLWSAKYGEHQQNGSLIWGKYVLGQKSVDKRTGEVPVEFKNPRSNPYIGACSFLCATESYITAMPGVTFDLTSMQPVARPTILHKSPCSMGSVVGEGMLFMSSFHCACSYQLNGNIIEMAGDARQYQRPAVETERLTRSANPDPVAPLPRAAADWPMFRASNSRSNASTATVPEKVGQQWTFALGHPYVNPGYPSDRSETSYEPTQPLAVGKLVITAGPDGVVRTLALADGKPLWTFYAGGQIPQSPAVVDGRVYVPSGDGFLYCVDAATGRELWRFRAAPAERRMMVYGHLVSTWPLFAGVLVQEGVVYTAASMLNMDATHVYALDAKTGHILWQNNTSGLPKENSEDGATVVGTFTVAQGRLWVRTTSYDLKTGECRLYADPKNPNLAKSSNQGSIDGGNAILNRYTGVVDGKFLLFGGRRFYESQSRPPPLGRSPQPLSIVELNADGTGMFPRIDLVNYTGAFAAWDERQLIATPAMADKTSINEAVKHAPILCWDLGKTLALARSERAEAAKITDYPSQVKWQARMNAQNMWEKATEFPMHQWLLDAHGTYAVALSTNALVAAYGIMDSPEKYDRSKPVVPTKWFVAALDRGTGKELWKLPLPTVPVCDGICIAHDGSVVVQLLDGSVVCIGEDIK